MIFLDAVLDNIISGLLSTFLKRLSKAHLHGIFQQIKSTGLHIRSQLRFCRIACDDVPDDFSCLCARACNLAKYAKGRKHLKPCIGSTAQNGITPCLLITHERIALGIPQVFELCIPIACFRCKHAAKSAELHTSSHQLRSCAVLGELPCRLACSLLYHFFSCFAGKHSFSSAFDKTQGTTGSTAHGSTSSSTGTRNHGTGSSTRPSTGSRPCGGIFQACID